MYTFVVTNLLIPIGRWNDGCRSITRKIWMSCIGIWKLSGIKVKTGQCHPHAKWTVRHYTTMVCTYFDGMLVSSAWQRWTGEYFPVSPFLLSSKPTSYPGHHPYRRNSTALNAPIFAFWNFWCTRAKYARLFFQFWTRFIDTWHGDAAFAERTGVPHTYTS